MGSYDGAEVSELVGLFLLNQLEKLIPRQIVGLYRDDGLAVINNHSGPEIERLRKSVIKLFKSIRLNVRIDSNIKTTDFLDIQFSASRRIFYIFSIRCFTKFPLLIFFKVTVNIIATIFSIQNKR